MDSNGTQYDMNEWVLTEFLKIIYIENRIIVNIVSQN
jgi:hypothetical protein